MNLKEQTGQTGLTGTDRTAWATEVDGTDGTDGTAEADGTGNCATAPDEETAMGSKVK